MPIYAKLYLLHLFITLYTKINSVTIFQTNLFEAPPSEYNGNLQL